MKKLCLILSALLAIESASLGSTPVGTAVLVKGRVGKYFGSHNVALHEGDRVEEGAVITAGPESSAKILLLDNTELKIGPNSSFRVESLRSQEPAVLTLGKGTVRTKVVKDPVVRENPRIKFIIRTRTAVMGVRGTDFDAIYSPETKITSVVTFEGSVSLAKTETPDAGAPTPPPPPIGQLIAQISDPRAVAVTEGTFSSSMPQLPQATIPTRISPAQFESLRKSDPMLNSKAPTVAPSPGGEKFYSPIPPGVDPKNFGAAGEGLEKGLKEKFGPRVFDQASSAKSGSSASPQGFYDAKSGAFAPPAGGFIDLKTGVYLPPPPGSTFDKNTGVFIPPPSMGGFDPKNGQFTPPPGTQISANGSLVPLDGSGGSGKGGHNGPFPPGMMPPPPGGFKVAGFVPGMPFVPGMMPPPGQPGMNSPPGGYLQPPQVPLIGGDGSCGAGCVPQAPPPGYQPPPLDPANSTQVQFSITVN